MWTTNLGLPLGTRTHTVRAPCGGVGLKAPDIFKPLGPALS